ncbi:MAG TPA: hypothetical protein VNT92_11615, partial [Acidimicrobiia bacterium]|nr:hypothetical protein [Acidimicrobiia bacterium]
MTKAGEVAHNRQPIALVIASAIVAIALFLTPAATAAPPPLLTQFGNTGSGAGQTVIPRGIAVDPTNGHVYVAD